MEGSTTSQYSTQQAHGKMFNFFVAVTGVTGGAHEKFIRKLKGQIQKKSVEESNYILAFCPSPSRTGTDVQEAMGKIPSGKPVILVVMHHRHDVEAPLDDSTKHVSRDDVKLTVDTLFWEGKFLKCSHNEKAVSKVQEAVGYSSTTVESPKNTSWFSAYFSTSTSTSEKKIEDTETSIITPKQETPGTSKPEKVEQDTKIEPWRDVHFRNKDTLLDIVTEFHPENENIKHVRILLLGPVGSGKSSFINSVSSILRGRMTQAADVDAIAGDTSYTTKYQTHTIKKRNKQNFPFVFNDIVGLGSDTGVHEDDINMALEGCVKDGYTFDPVSAMSEEDRLYNPNPKPEDKTHVLVLVIPADQMTTSSLDSMMKMKVIADNIGIPQICILTKIDEACCLVKEDVKNVYKSKDMQEKMEEVSVKVGIQMDYIFPVKNYHEETDLDDDIDVLILIALQNMIHIGKDFINKTKSDTKSSE